MEFLIEKTLELFLIVKKIERAKKKIEYFNYHIQRCKKDEDRNKIFALAFVEICYLKSLLIK